MHLNTKKGFTIIELLIVIAIIGILATLVLRSVSGAQAKARTSKAERELQLIDKAIAVMALDIAKWPNGCSANVSSNPEVDVVDAEAGLTQLPPIGVIDVGCEWTSADITFWDGPYIQDDSIIDPWGNSYVFDPDYYPWQNCSSKATLPLTSVVATLGPDATTYTCDDIFRIISR